MRLSGSHKDRRVRMSKEDLAAKEAVHGQKMIEVKLRFWTNDIAPEEGR